MPDAQDELERQAVRREALLPVAREVAWSALASAEGLSGWLADEVALEVRAGARGTVRWESGEERLATVEEVEPEKRLSLHWCAPGGEPSLVELVLDEVPGGTRLVVLEVPLRALRAVAAELVQSSARSEGPQMLASGASRRRGALVA